MAKPLSPGKKSTKRRRCGLSNKSEITDEEYKEFYKHIAHDFNDPLTWSRNRVEGQREYTSLLYIPSQAPWDMWNRDHKHGLNCWFNACLSWTTLNSLCRTICASCVA